MVLYLETPFFPSLDAFQDISHESYSTVRLYYLGCEEISVWTNVMSLFFTSQTYFQVTEYVLKIKYASHYLPHTYFFSCIIYISPLFQKFQISFNLGLLCGSRQPLRVMS